MNVSRQPSPAGAARNRAFTMIEMLVVFAIISIVVSLVLAGSGYAIVLARQKRVETERDRFVAAIEAYKAKLGQYPPDNPANPAQSPLFYELTGMVIAQFDTGTPPAPSIYSNQATGDRFRIPNNDLTMVYGAGIQGFANFATDSTAVNNFLSSEAMSGYTGKIVTGGVTNTFLGVQVSGPLQTNTIDGKQMCPWSYVAKSPTHSPTNNADTYDLWVDVKLGKTIYRISNWSKEPQPL
jgi:prepilin-type N-terminal cleavage/methylation domain-containing protein